MDVRLLKPCKWLTTQQNMDRINIQKKIIKDYTSAQKKQLANDLKNTYRVDQVVALTQKKIKADLNVLYTKMRKNTLTPSAKKALLHKISVNRTVAEEMDIEGQPINSDPFYKPTVDNGDFVKDMYQAMQKATDKQLFSNRLHWGNFLNAQDTVRVNEFPDVAKDFLKKYIRLITAQDKKRIVESGFFYKLFHHSSAKED